MTEQELTDELADLQQKRLDLAARLDQETLQLNLWDEHVTLLQKMLVTLRTQGEQEVELVQVAVEEAKMKAATPIVQAARVTTSLGA